jgi:hypothetical protein
MNPYRENKDTVQGDIFAEYRLKEKKKNKTERGELLKYFSEKLDKPIGYVAMRCKGMEVVDLYFLKAIADKYSLEGKGPWAKCWYGAIKEAK